MSHANPEEPPYRRPSPGLAPGQPRPATRGGMSSPTLHGRVGSPSNTALSCEARLNEDGARSAPSKGPARFVSFSALLGGRSPSISLPFLATRLRQDNPAGQSAS